MINDLDIWRAANLLIKRHGDDAGIVAAQHADELLNHRDLEGSAHLGRSQRYHAYRPGRG